MTAEPQQSKPEEPEVVGLLAEFPEQDSLIDAAKSLRTSGYSTLDAYTPFPIHALDGALGVRPTRLPWLVLGAGLTGGALALFFQWWMNAVDYPFLISGKPLFSLPANIPVTFEVIILAAAFTAFLGMLLLNGLPKLESPLFRAEGFESVTTDGFFLSVDSSDDLFHEEETLGALKSLGAARVEKLIGYTKPQALPSSIWPVVAVILAIALLPPVMIAKARSTTSEKPRLHNFFDMDFQPKFKSQTTTSMFTDGRSMRPRVPGTIPRGSILENPAVELGYASTGTDLDETDAPASQEPNWTEEFPLQVTTELMERGQLSFNVHCAVCHGRAGYGNGLVSQRATELQQGTWVPPTSIHADHVRKQPDGQLYNVITNGVRKMPAYGHQISVKDRWAIVLYLRALQRSQQTSLADVPETIRPTLREMN